MFFYVFFNEVKGEKMKNKEVKCPRCGGTGRVTKSVSPASFKTWEEKCPVCYGGDANRLGKAVDPADFEERNRRLA